MALTVVNPATEEAVAELEPAGVEETDAAVAAARAAFPAWRAVTPDDRARLLRRLAALVEEHGEELARLETRNVGKPISDSRAEVAMMSGNAAGRLASAAAVAAMRASSSAGFT